MIWTTWRQHRFEGACALALTALLAACIAYVARELAIAPCGPQAVEGYTSGVGYCLPDDVGGQVAQLIFGLNLFNYGLVLLPALAGAFIGAPLVARETENGTHRLAWTQGVTRTRWLLAKLVLVAIPLLLAAAVVGLLEIRLLDLQSPLANHWAFFDQQAPMTIASTFFALALGVALGALIGRSVPAMAGTLFAFVVVRIGIAEVARARYMTPLAAATQDPGGIDDRLRPTAWWIDQPRWYDASGRMLSDREVLAMRGEIGYIREHGLTLVQHYQPAERFWTFQGIESAILAGLALLLLAFALYWVRHRVS